METGNLGKYVKVKTANHKPIFSLAEWSQALTEEGGEYVASAIRKCNVTL